MRRILAILAAAIALLATPAFAQAPQPSITDQVNAMAANAGQIIASFRGEIMAQQQQLAADAAQIAALRAQVGKKAPKKAPPKP